MSHQIRQATWTLERGQSVSSDEARLVMQTDGNLVVYDELDFPRWGSDTVDEGWRATFQDDGNLVVYARSNKAVWGSGTEGHPGSQLWIQDDGNVVIYDQLFTPIWATNTAH
ncbi:hypothetical protein [Streptomyces sp. GbtcB7]|uniref:hypothetical protein n=1 Tax=Streptomyces sp. GbtcB7 TaxID=2824752 RepID=UPI001C303343|nr:hypothetical protein [Streptomyces sp. GbtcB7]